MLVVAGADLLSWRLPPTEEDEAGKPGAGYSTIINYIIKSHTKKLIHQLILIYSILIITITITLAFALYHNIINCSESF